MSHDIIRRFLFDSSTSTMQLSDYNYDLPSDLIAQTPLAVRTASRLLVMNRQNGELADKYFADIVDVIKPEDLLVFNNTKVIPARLYGHKQTGGKIELLLERLLDKNQALTHIRANKAPKQGSILVLEGDVQLRIIEKIHDLYMVEFSCNNLLDYLDRYGHVPLPPYINRDDQAHDKERYQTVFAKHPGAVAAPTAGLHFDENLLSHLARKGVETAQVTLHVGAGTFQPVRNNDLSKHVMHAEYVEVSQAVVEAVERCKQRGGRVFAVGTTTVRSLEAASSSGVLHSYSGDTRLFITPGYCFNSVDALITNFHLPLSTLLMLVSAFSSRKNILNAYNHAVSNAYRFFSYGDAMLLI